MPSSRAAGLRVRSENRLTAERARELLTYDPETGIIRWRVRQGHMLPGTQAGGPGPKGYRSVKVDHELHFSHRLAWLLHTGEYPSGELDHEDRNRANNRWSNLRPATPTQNNRNIGIRRDNKSGIRGVYLQKGKWVASIRVDRKKTFLGYHPTKEAAGAAYAEAARRHFGEFAG